MIKSEKIKRLYRYATASLLCAAAVLSAGGCSEITTSELPPTTVNDYVYKSDNCYFTENSGDDAKFITVAQGEVSTLKSCFFDQHITHQGLTYGVKFTYSKFDGKLVASDAQKKEADAYFLEIPAEQDKGIFICLNVPSQNYYPVMFDLRNCSVKDPLEGTGAEELWIDSFSVSPDFKNFLLICDKNESVYLCKTAEKSLSDMTVLTGITDLSGAFWADNGTIILTKNVDSDTSSASVETWAYDTQTGKSSKTTDGYTLFDDQSNYGLKLFGTRYALYIEKNGKVKSVDLVDGSSKTVSGYTYSKRCSVDISTHEKGTLLLMSKKNASNDTQVAYLVNLADAVISKQREIPAEFTTVAYFDENNLIAYSDTGSYSIYPMGED